MQTWSATAAAAEGAAAAEEEEEAAERPWMTKEPCSSHSTSFPC